jgi:hypothetical protein
MPVARASGEAEGLNRARGDDRQGLEGLGQGAQAYRHLRVAQEGQQVAFSIHHRDEAAVVAFHQGAPGDFHQYGCIHGNLLLNSDLVPKLSLGTRMKAGIFNNPFYLDPNYCQLLFISFFLLSWQTDA